MVVELWGNEEADSMLPSLEECQRRIKTFDSNYPGSTFDEFWQYKLEVEKSGSILDSTHLDETAKLLDTKLLRHPKWGLWWTHIPPIEEIKRILNGIYDEYQIIKSVELGDNSLVVDKNFSKALCSIYDKLCGITHTRWGDLPDNTRASYLVGKSKVLMFIWGQTPGFDSKVVWNLTIGNSKVEHDRLPICVGVTKYTAQEFHETLQILDGWVQMWNRKYKNRRPLQRLSSNRPRPVGRIIDIIYW